jgi:hypothetical protein
MGEGVERKRRKQVRGEEKRRRREKVEKKR